MEVNPQHRAEQRGPVYGPGPEYRGRPGQGDGNLNDLNRKVRSFLFKVGSKFQNSNYYFHPSFLENVKLYEPMFSDMFFTHYVTGMIVFFSKISEKLHLWDYFIEMEIFLDFGVGVPGIDEALQN